MIAAIPPYQPSPTGSPCVPATAAVTAYYYYDCYNKDDYMKRYNMDDQQDHHRHERRPSSPPPPPSPTRLSHDVGGGDPHLSSQRLVRRPLQQHNDYKNNDEDFNYDNNILFCNWYIKSNREWPPAHQTAYQRSERIPTLA
jgi:hypothetical protein